MALGAAVKYKKKIWLQPVGLNYFKGHKFRSKVIVEFGVPLEVPNDLIELYTSNRREAISKLLIRIE
jgi:glycerol-3-phosphate O-acyltransferase/dihydroxyacetone phosphate acyltransferase